MSIKKTLVRSGIAVAIVAALLGGLAPMTDASTTYMSGSEDCAYVHRQAAAYVNGWTYVDANAGGHNDHRGGSLQANGQPYYALAKSGSYSANWWVYAEPSIISGGGTCTM